MAKSKVNGKSAAGYDSFDDDKKVTTNSAEIQHGEEKTGFESLTFVTIDLKIAEIAQAITANKEKGVPLPASLTRIKAHNTKQVEKDRD